jgi:hypothetical protein
MGAEVSIDLSFKKKSWQVWFQLNLIPVLVRLTIGFVIIP